MSYFRLRSYLVMLLVFFAIFTVSLSGCKQQQEKEAKVVESEKKAEVVKIGAVLLLSGGNALWGENARKAIDLIIQDVNNKDGVNGKKINIIYEDSKGDPKVSVSSFKKLVEINKVPAVLGDMVSATTLAMAPLANQSKVILIGISSSSPAVTDAGIFVYRVWPSDLYEGKVFAKWVYDEGYHNVGIIYLNNDYGDGLKEAFKVSFSNLGGKVINEESYLEKEHDFRPIVSKISQNNPQAVYIVGYYEDTGRIIRQLREGGYQGKLLGTSSSVHEKIFEIADKAVEGFVAAVVNDFDMENLTPEQKVFFENFKNNYKIEPDWAATHAADAIMIIVSCLKQNNYDGEKLKNCIDNQKTFHGINKGLTFDENGDVINKPIAVKEAKGGTFVTLWKED